MLCAISGEAPQHPVASTKSGNVFEKRLIEAYITENHKDPVTGEELELEDLIDLKTSRIVTPRPPTLTSIPALLSTFQTEWDALALETFTIRQQLYQTRQELATALYQNDAAVRVIARLTRERDEARDALSKISVNGGIANNEDAMQVDSPGMSAELVAVVEETHEQLSKSRRKRPIPEDWANVETIANFVIGSTSKSLSPQCTSLALHTSGDLTIVGGAKAGVYSISHNKLQRAIKADGSITSAVWYGDEPVVSTFTGSVTMAGGKDAIIESHNGPVRDIALHPSGRLLASVGADGNFVFYDLVKGQTVMQVHTDSDLTTANFHPDGHLFAAGGNDGQIKFFHVKSGESAGVNFELTGPVQDVSFSENGFFFAAVAKDSTNVIIYDIRKEGKAAEAKILEIGGQVDCIEWDYSGQFLAAAGPGGLTIAHYAKSSKSWSDIISVAVPAVALKWGLEAKTLVTVNDKGVVSVLGSE